MTLSWRVFETVLCALIVLPVQTIALWPATRRLPLSRRLFVLYQSAWMTLRDIWTAPREAQP